VLSARATYRLGDARDLPFPAHSFDVVLCHFVLLWIDDAARAVREMARVTRPGGAVVACAEPDYGGRIDWPDLPLGRLQAEALRREGADPLAGRKLKVWFAGAGLQTEVGVYPCLWDDAALRAEFEGEWRLMERTLAGFASPLTSPEELERLKAEDWAAVEAGARTVFMPMFYAVGRRL
jgi:SAM-dependent methyltransferase